MTVKLPYAVIVRHPSRWTPPRNKPPTEWLVWKIGRETPKRIYRQEEKPAERWRYDSYEIKNQAVVQRFDTREEAEAFIEQAKAALSAEIDEVNAAREANDAARIRLQVAVRNLDTATIKFWGDRNA